MHNSIDDISPERRKSTGLRIKGPRPPSEETKQHEAKNVVDLTSDGAKGAFGKSGVSEGGNTLVKLLGKVPGAKEAIGEGKKQSSTVQSSAYLTQSQTPTTISRTNTKSTAADSAS